MMRAETTRSVRSFINISIYVLLLGVVVSRLGTYVFKPPFPWGVGAIVALVPDLGRRQEALSFRSRRYGVGRSESAESEARRAQRPLSGIPQAGAAGGDIRSNSASREREEGSAENWRRHFPCCLPSDVVCWVVSRQVVMMVEER